MRTSSVALSHIQLDTPQNWTVGNRTSKNYFERWGNVKKRLPLKCRCLHKSKENKLFTLVLFHPCRDFVMERGLPFQLGFKEKKRDLNSLLEQWAFLQQIRYGRSWKIVWIIVHHLKNSMMVSPISSVVYPSD